jgi:hypothetical protein
MKIVLTTQLNLTSRRIEPIEQSMLNAKWVFVFYEGRFYSDAEMSGKRVAREPALRYNVKFSSSCKQRQKKFFVAKET